MKLLGYSVDQPRPAQAGPEGEAHPSTGKRRRRRCRYKLAAHDRCFGRVGREGPERRSQCAAQTESQGQVRRTGRSARGTTTRCTSTYRRSTSRRSRPTRCRSSPASRGTGRCCRLPVSGGAKDSSDRAIVANLAIVPSDSSKPKPAKLPSVSVDRLEASDGQDQDRRQARRAGVGDCHGARPVRRHEDGDGGPEGSRRRLRQAALERHEPLRGGRGAGERTSSVASRRTPRIRTSGRKTPWS